MTTAGWIVARYAAVISTAALVWQVVSWRLTRKNRVRVQVNAALIPMNDGTMPDAISVVVVNRSDYAVRVAA